MSVIYFSDLRDIVNPNDDVTIYLETRDVEIFGRMPNFNEQYNGLSVERITSKNGIMYISLDDRYLETDKPIMSVHSFIETFNVFNTPISFSFLGYSKDVYYYEYRPTDEIPEMFMKARIVGVDVNLQMGSIGGWTGIDLLIACKPPEMEDKTNITNDTVKTAVLKFFNLPIKLVGEGIIDVVYDDASKVPETYYDYKVEEYLAFQVEEPLPNGKVAGIKVVISK